MVGARRGGAIAQAVLIVTGAALTMSLLGRVQHSDSIHMPSLVLWAWERPEDVRFIDSASTGVAFLAASVEIDNSGAARVRPRQQPLQLAPGTALTAVVRIESTGKGVFGDPGKIAAGIAQIAGRDGIEALQIDYDARVSERTFYRSLLRELHSKTRRPVSVTALASWCDGDTWIGAETVFEAAPMFFRMGSNETRNMPIRAPVCRDAIGLSTDEAWPATRPAGLSRNARIYVFNPRAWTKEDYERVREEAGEWR
jgi:hypothetical protein